MKSYTKADEIGAPASAQREANINGSHRTKLLNSMTFIVKELKESHSKIDESIYRVSKDTAWQEIESFYRTKLETSGWQRDNAAPLQGIDYEQAVWKKEGWFNKQTIVIALIDAGGAENNDAKFLAIFLAEK